MDEFSTLLNPFEEELDLDPLKDSNRDTGFIDHFWNLDTVQVSEAEEKIGERH